MNDHTSYSRAVYVVDGNRTPFLKVRGKPGPFSASDLAVQAGRELLLRQPFPATALSEVILGCVMPREDEANIARIVSLRLGCGKTVPAWTVQRNCGSGMQALDCAAQAIASGRSELVLAGGTESMSHAPLLFNGDMVNWLADWQAARTWSTKIRLFTQLKPHFFKPVIALLHGLSDPIVNLNMGQTAEILAQRFQISREQMDEFALASHQRLMEARNQGYLQSEIKTIYDDQGHLFDFDDGVRHDTTLAALAKLKPIFVKKFGTVTAGNSSQVTDGAALLLLASEQAVARYQLPVLGRIVDTQWAGVGPEEMGLGPVYASTALLQRQQMTREDVDYWEINEAFAAQVLACLAAWADEDYCRKNLHLETAFGKIDHSHLNVDGGAIALGHPVGASGARIVLHLLEVLKRRQAKRGVASQCIGGGQGGAMLLERV